MWAGGYEINVGTVSLSIDMGSGWNWFSVNVAGDDMSPNAVLDALEPDLNDIVKDQNLFATYYGEDYGWVGALATMSPGKGYMLSVSYDSDLVYPDGSSGMARIVTPLAEAKVLPTSISSWSVNPRDYEFNATMTISIDSRSDFDGDFVGVFVGSECRGMAERTEFVIDGSYHYSIMVYSNVTEGEELSFKYYSSLDNEVINYSENVEFIANMNVGNGFSTFSLINETGTFEQPVFYSLSEAYPNPFNPVTSFNLTLEVDGMVEVAVYDINGRKIAELVNGYYQAGTHALVWDATYHTSGIYFVKIQAVSSTSSGFEYENTQKLMLIK